MAFARILNFENAIILAPKKSLSLSNLVLLEVLYFEDPDDYFWQIRDIRYLVNKNHLTR